MQENPIWIQLGYVCYTGFHLAQTIVSAALTVAFVTLCAMFTLVYYESSYLSPNLEARAHGRAEFVFLLVKSVLVVCIEVFPHYTGTRMLTAIVVVSSIVLVVTYAAMMPYLHHVMNRVMLAIVCTFAWASASVLLTLVHPTFDAAILMYAGMPLAAFCGTALADWRARRVVRGAVTHMHTFFDVELKVRYLLHNALWGDPTDRVATRVVSPGSAEQVSVGVPMAALDDEGTDDADARIAHVRAALSPAVIKEAEALYRSGLARFRGAALLNIFAARFFILYCDNNHLEMR
jgi:hypothetical protein